MHLIIAFAAPSSDAQRTALQQLRLPHLAQALVEWPPAQRWVGEDMALTPPHEQAQAQAIGLTGADGALPWAARAALADGVVVGSQAWAELTPVHLDVGADHFTLTPPQALGLDQAASRALLDIVRPLFESEGFALAWGAPLRWYAAHDCFEQLACASLDRVVGRRIGPWLPALRHTQLLRRIQNEVQMLLYTHPFNAEREALGQRAVNSFWVSGCGRHQAPARVPAPTLDLSLREAALNDDAPAWAQAWQTLDATLVAALHADPQARLTLCGERGAAAWAFSPSWPDRAWRRARALWRQPDAAQLLDGL